MEFKIASANISVAAVKHRPRDVQQALEGLFEHHGVTSVGIQEGGEGRKLIRAAARAVDASVYFGEGRDGEDSTPIIYLNSVKNPKFSSVQLTERTPAGHGSVVDVLHPKYLVTVKYGVPGSLVRVKHNNTHGIVSQQVEINGRVAQKQFRNTAFVVQRQKGARFVSMDGNALPGAANLAPLARELQSSQKHLGEIDTKGNRPIDDIYSINQKGVYVPKSHFTVKNPGDHLWYVLVGNLG